MKKELCPGKIEGRHGKGHKGSREGSGKVRSMVSGIEQNPELLDTATDCLATLGEVMHFSH